MNSVNRLEVYIPLEAEVKNIPLWSLPSKVLRKMGLPSTDFKGSKKLSSSPEGIWISPAVIRRKGQKQASPTGKDLMEKESSLRTASGPLRMSFVSSNRAAYRVLKEIPGTNVVPLPQGSAPRIYQTAVVIYRGRIYLSLRKNSLSLSDGSSPPTTSLSSSSSSKSQQKELQNENRPMKKNTLYKENKKDDIHEVRDVSSPMSTRPVLQSTHSEPSVDSRPHTDVRGQQATQEAAAALNPVWFEPVGGSSEGGECELQDLDGEDAESDSAERTDRSSQSNVRIEPLSAARGSTSLVKECDFDDLAQEERIAQMKARIRQNKAALNSLNSAV